jgi:hypothetical protein
MINTSIPMYCMYERTFEQKMYRHSRYGLFPRFLAHMMSSGEESAACCDDSNKWEFEDSDFLQNPDPCVAGAIPFPNKKLSGKDSSHSIRQGSATIGSCTVIQVKSCLDLVYTGNEVTDFKVQGEFQAVIIKDGI